MHDAVQGMMIHYRFTLACFTGGIIFFMISALLYAWMQFTWELVRAVTFARPSSPLPSYALPTALRSAARHHGVPPVCPLAPAVARPAPFRRCP